MPQSPLSRLQETVRTSAEIRREGADAARRARAELVETRAALRKAIVESRKLMAEIDALIAWK
jgi:hypothetical protein